MAFSDRIFGTIVGKSLNDEDDPLRWWYMVYEDKNKKFAGAFIIEARNEKLMGPYDRMEELKLEPENSSVRQKIEIPDGDLPSAEYRNRKLSAEEVRSIWPKFFAEKR